MISQAVAPSLDGDDGRVVQEAVEDCGGGHGISDHGSPVFHRAVGGDDGGGLFVPPHKELHEVLGRARGSAVQAQIVDDQEWGP